MKVSGLYWRAERDVGDSFFGNEERLVALKHVAVEAWIVESTAEVNIKHIL